MTPKNSSTARQRRDRLIGFALIVVAFMLGGTIVASTIGRPPVVFGSDLDLYLNATRSYLAGSGFYPAYEIAGPFPVVDGVVLYPPSTIPLFVPFLILPRLLWWLIPLGVAAHTVMWWRPSMLAWGVIAVLAAYPQSSGLVVHGNPAMWAMMAMALASRRRWMSAFALLKPSLLPFALWGIRDRRWWFVVGTAAVLSLAMVAAWRDYLAVLGNVQSSFFYSLGDIPLVAIPVVARLGSSRRADF